MVLKVGFMMEPFLLGTRPPAGAKHQVLVTAPVARRLLHPTNPKVVAEVTEDHARLGDEVVNVDHGALDFPALVAGVGSCHDGSYT